MLGRQLPKIETMLRGAADDITAFADFPVPHYKKIWSTNPLERLNKEVKRRSAPCSVDVVEIAGQERNRVRSYHCCLLPKRSHRHGTRCTRKG